MQWTCVVGVWRFAMRVGSAQPITRLWGREAETRNQKFTLRQECSIGAAVSCCISIGFYAPVEGEL